MVGIGRKADSIIAVDVAHRDLIAGRSGDMEGRTFTIRADVQSVGKAFAITGKFLSIGTVEIHVKDLARFFERATCIKMRLSLISMPPP